MKLQDFNPTHNDIITCNRRLLWGAGDIWKTGNDGVLHRHISKFGNLLTVKIPDSIPIKYKGRKATSAIICCNSCELITSVEIHYGNPFTDGFAVAYIPGKASKDITNSYRKQKKK